MAFEKYKSSVEPKDYLIKKSLIINGVKHILILGNWKAQVFQYELFNKESEPYLFCYFSSKYEYGKSKGSHKPIIYHIGFDINTLLIDYKRGYAYIPCTTFENAVRETYLTTYKKIVKTSLKEFIKFLYMGMVFYKDFNSWGTPLEIKKEDMGISTFLDEKDFIQYSSRTKKGVSKPSTFVIPEPKSPKEIAKEENERILAILYPEIMEF